MKRYVIDHWIQQKDNPFVENYPLLEQPISQPLPMQNPMPGAQTQGNPPQDQFPPETTPTPPVEAQPPTPAPQDAMKDMGAVETKPETDEVQPEEEENSPNIDFETEKIDYMDLAVQRKSEEMMDKLLEMREVKKLSPGQYKFIEDNIQILSLTKDVDFADLQRKVYKQIKDTYAYLAEEKSNQEAAPEPERLEHTSLMEAPEDEMGGIAEDPNNAPAPEIGNMEPDLNAPIEEPQEPEPDINNTPEEETNTDQEEQITDLPGFEMVKQEEKLSGLELYSILSNEVEQYPNIVNTFIKMTNFYSMKSDLFRKTIASIINAVQIGTGGTLEDLFVPIDKDGVGIKVCTRVYTGFGNIQIGKWTLEFDDPEKYLSEPELLKLNDSGSPEEKEVLRKRVVIESIAESFRDRIFIILIVEPETGERHEIGFNFSELVKTGWKEGLISIDFKANVGKGEAGVEVNGELIDLQEIQISFIDENPDNLDDQGLPEKDHVELMKIKNGLLYLTIDKDNFQNFSEKVQEGMFYKSKPFDAGEEELKKTQRCVPDIKEILLRKC